MPKKLIIAHRGASKLAHENTIEAFKKAIDLGVDGIEFDIRRTKDNVLAVFHDPDILGQKLSNLTYSELNEIAAKQGFRIPTYGEVLELVKNTQNILIEIKEPGYENTIAELALKFLKPEQFGIISFLAKPLMLIRQGFPQIKLGLSLGVPHWDFKPILNFILRSKRILSFVDFVTANEWLYHIGFTKFFSPGFPVAIWTVDAEAELRAYLKEPGVKELMTNVPDLALKIRDGRN